MNDLRGDLEEDLLVRRRFDRDEVERCLPCLADRDLFSEGGRRLLRDLLGGGER